MNKLFKKIYIFFIVKYQQYKGKNTYSHKPTQYTSIVRYVLNHGDVVIKSLREFIRWDENCVVIALEKTHKVTDDTYNLRGGLGKSFI